MEADKVFKGGSQVCCVLDNHQMLGQLTNRFAVKFQRDQIPENVETIGWNLVSIKHRSNMGQDSFHCLHSRYGVYAEQKQFCEWFWTQ